MTDQVEHLKNALRDVLKAIAFDNPHAVCCTIWVGPSPIGDFIMNALDEEIDLEGSEFQNTPYRCNKTDDLFVVPVKRVDFSGLKKPTFEGMSHQTKMKCDWWNAAIDQCQKLVDGEK